MVMVVDQFERNIAAAAKAVFILQSYGTAEEVAEKLIVGENRVPQALKRGRILSGLAARVELMPFTNTFQMEIFPRPLKLGPFKTDQTEPLTH